MIEQVLPRLKTTLTTYLATEAAKMDTVSAPAGMSSVTVPVPAAAAIYIDAVGEHEIFDHTAVIVFEESRSQKQAAGGEDGRYMGSSSRIVDWRHELELRVGVLGQDRVTTGTLLRRLVSAVQVTLDRYAWSASAGTNTGEPYYVNVTTIDWGGIGGREDGKFTRSAIVTIEAFERTQIIYTDI